MSFHWYARKVRNPRLPIWTRRAAFYSCVLRYCWLTQQPYLQIRGAFTSQFALNGDRAPSEQRLLDALAALERARRQFLERLRAFERKRIRQKLRGQRCPQPADIQALYSPSQGHEQPMS